MALPPSDIDNWNRIAETYADQAGLPSDPVYQQFKGVLWDCLGQLPEKKVLDLGCGHGWLSQALVEAGAQVWGVDGSSALLEKARLRCPQATFIQADLMAGLPHLAEQFDRILAYMLLMDVPAVGTLLQALAHRLNPGGKLVFTIPHPCFFHYPTRRAADGEMYSAISAYLQPEIWWIDTFGGHRHYHRSLTTYFDLLRAAGFAVTRLYEPPHIAQAPEAAAFYNGIAKFLLVEACLHP